MRFLLRGCSGSGGETAVKRPRVGLALVDATPTGSISRWSAGGGKSRSRDCVQVEVAEDRDGVTVTVDRLVAWTSLDYRLRAGLVGTGRSGAPAVPCVPAGLPHAVAGDGEPDSGACIALALAPLEALIDARSPFTSQLTACQVMSAERVSTTGASQPQACSSERSAQDT